MRRQAAASLVQMLVVVAIIAICSAIGGPELGRMVRYQQLKSAAFDLFDALALARSLAITQGERVMLAPLDGRDWMQGWAVFADHDGDHRPGPADEIFARHGPVRGDIRLRSTFPGPAQAPYIAYNGAGRSCSAASSLAARWGSLSLTLEGHTRRITVNMLGRARMCDPERDRSGCEQP